eukprot:gene6808-8447_t
MFSHFGEIDSCRVMIDLVTRQSKGFGFVKFKDSASAQFAIQQMNGAKIEKKTLLVRYATVNSQNEDESTVASNNVYIKGLPLHMTQDQLVSLFSKYGTILESKLLLDIATNTSRGQALVRFSEVDAATKSIKALNDFVFPGSDKPIIVRYAKNEDEKDKKKQKLTTQTQQQQKRTSNLRFSPYPSPSVSPLTSTLYPFYQVPTLPTIHSPLIGGTTPTMIPAGTDPTNLYVYNLPPDADDALLYRLFSPSGAISSVKIIKDPVTKACKGYGFVRMVNIADSINALNMVNGLTVSGKVIQVSFKK